MNWVCALLLAGVPPAQQQPSSPNSEMLVALADAQRLQPEIAEYTRYLTTFAVPEQHRQTFEKVLTFHLWSISLRANPPQLRRVSPTVLAMDLRDFGIDKFVYGRLQWRDPYFHVPLTKDGKTLDQSSSYFGFWLEPKAITELAKLTKSSVPILRADWFFVETSIQDGRGKPGEGTGYYDFIKVRSRKDFEKLVGFDEKIAERREAEWIAVVKDSGVAYHSRQVVRYGSIDGGYWVTRDVLDEGKADRNAIERLDKDFKHQAEEHYGIGPSGLPVYFLSDADGVIQDAAPDKIGVDTTRPGKRKRIEICMSCVRCHVEILRPFDNWIAENIVIPNQALLAKERADLLRTKYFRDLSGKLLRDNQSYSDRLKECNGLTPAANAKAYAVAWDRYAEDQLTIEDCARECGSTVQTLRIVLESQAEQQLLRPALVELVGKRKKVGTIKREHWEELYPVVIMLLEQSRAKK